MRNKISQRSIEDLAENAAGVIKESWTNEKDARERARDAASLIDRRKNWPDHCYEAELERIEKLILNSLNL